MGGSVAIGLGLNSWVFALIGLGWFNSTSVLLVGFFFLQTQQSTEARIARSPGIPKVKARINPNFPYFGSHFSKLFFVEPELQIKQVLVLSQESQFSMHFVHTRGSLDWSWSSQFCNYHKRSWFLHIFHIQEKNIHCTCCLIFDIPPHIRNTLLLLCHKICSHLHNLLHHSHNYPQRSLRQARVH